MDSKERAALIREGNAAFNDADYPKARELYLRCDYKDGLIRLGDYYMYEKKLPILAYGYYKKAGHTQKIDEIFQRMLYALGTWIGMDKFKIKEAPATNDKPLSPDDFTVHPILKAKAMEILQKSGKK
ncbi:MAG: hypothetical protein IPO06_05815 [Leptospiraceae bacterium]|jgi:hypothetical protein|nr:hypothetical protein [Leptospiraceae bacterium]MBK7055060.1 hypothetical protein [Leptospiraceae bacterium]MBK9498897.1 hypothetical protein [Leptospiraceae bacterium]